MKITKEFIETLWARWNTESPILFKRFTNFGISLIASGTSVLTFTSMNPLPDFTLPTFMIEVAKGFLYIGAGITAISKLTVQQ
jgi:hypothetical protein